MAAAPGHRYSQTLKASGSVVGLIEGIAGATQNIVQGIYACRVIWR
jgi:hypothetical protein